MFHAHTDVALVVFDASSEDDEQVYEARQHVRGKWE